MADYLKSTQLKHWTFASQVDVDGLRAKAKDKYTHSKKCAPIELLSPEAEKGFVNIYLDMIFKLCSKEQLNDILREQKFSERLHWTAATLFKRFYLRRSIMAENPQLMAVVAIYAASKIEEIPLSTELRGIKVDRLAALAKLPTDLIVDNEIRFLAGVNFEMVVHHPTRVLEGIFEHLRAEQAERTEDRWESLEKACHKFLRSTLLCDAAFLYSPSKIAFVSLVAAFNQLESPPSFSVKELLAWSIPAQVGQAEIVDSLISIHGAIQSSLETAKTHAELVGKTVRTGAMTAWVERWRQQFEGLSMKPDKKRKREEEEERAG